MVPEVAGFSLVKAFSVPVEALEMAYGRIYLIRLFLRSLRSLALWIVILHLGMWIAMVMFHIIITVNIIRGIPWSIGGRFWIYPSKGVLERFAPVFGAAREMTLIKDGMSSGKHC